MVAWRWGIGLAMLCAAASVRADRAALLVGVDRYPFITVESQQLHGAAQDLKQMRAVLEYCGIKVQTLQGESATRSTIQQSLDSLAAAAGSGDQVVFYFSGRGSVTTEGGSPQDLEPTLVPFDGKAASSSADVPISALENWARAIADRGAVPIVILDACYRQLGTRGEDRFYKNVPRCVAREGTPRKRLYAGPGVFIAATDGLGLCYEYRVDFDTNTWAGAFTDEFANAAMSALIRGRRPTYAELVDGVRRVFASRPGYMPGLVPYPARAEMPAEYEKPIFLTAQKPPPPTATQKATLAGFTGKVKVKLRFLRVGLDPSPQVTGPDRERILESCAKAFEKGLPGRAPGAYLIPQYGDRPDRIVVLSRAGKELEATVLGNLVDEFRKPTFRAKDPEGLLRAGLAEYLERQACAVRLFRLGETDTPTGSGDWRIAPVKPVFRPGEDFVFTVDSPSGGFLYLLEQDDASGLVQMVWPAPQDYDNALQPGKVRLPRSAFEINRNSPEGKSLVRAVLVQPESARSIPPLTPPARVLWVAQTGQVNPKYAGAELKHLRAVVGAINSKKARWSAQSFTYQTAK